MFVHFVKIWWKSFSRMERKRPVKFINLLWARSRGVITCMFSTDKYLNIHTVYCLCNEHLCLFKGQQKVFFNTFVSVVQEHEANIT